MYKQHKRKVIGKSNIPVTYFFLLAENESNIKVSGGSVFFIMLL